ncbi:MAG: hypothetical protein ACE5F3_03755 [Mariprofundaceae bacterium]
MQLAAMQAVSVSRHDFDAMLHFARLMHRMKFSPAYVEALLPQLPVSALKEPEQPSVLMGYDFHITSDGPKLIEINNNAGGLYIADGQWLPQPELQEWKDTLQQRLQGMFPEHWQNLAIMDENVETQFMYPEMLAYAELLQSRTRKIFVVSPKDVIEGKDGLYVETVKLDAIYNRHTDFYLESGPLCHIRKAYLAGQIALSPNPRSYALLGDKGRMVDWWRQGLLDGFLADDEVTFIRCIVPETRRLSDVESELAWAERKQWVFKPAARHGGKGVLLGRAMSSKRFGEMDRHSTVMQRYVAPSKVGEFKFDMRLYMHGERLIAVAGRLWKGQVTNFREPGSGWVPVAIED